MKQIDSDTRYYIDINIKTKQIIDWDCGQRQELEQKLSNTDHIRVFLTKGQYIKLEKYEQQ